MIDFVAVVSGIGALGFGLVMGWVTYGTLRRSKRDSLSDIATVIGAVGGAAVTGLFPKESGAFGAYCIGLTLGFFLYLRAATRPNAPDWLGEQPNASGANAGGNSGLPNSNRPKNQ